MSGSPSTVIEALTSSLEAASAHNPNDADKPAAVLWTDRDAQWQPLLPRLQAMMPELLVHDQENYSPEERVGPSIWLRCVIDRALEAPGLSAEMTPIVYLPGVLRQELGAAESCPNHLKPLVELQYRGTCWTQKNGRDWTVEAFMVSKDGGLGLDVARDSATRQALQGRVNDGGALSGRDITAVNKTVSALLKLLYPDPDMEVPDDELEALVRIALEARRRVKEQQKRVFKSEFRNTHFSYAMGEDGVEKFVSTPELHSDEAIDPDPLPPGQGWGISPGSPETGPSLYRIEVTAGKGNGVRILNAPVPPAFRESVRYAEQNLYTRVKELVGDRGPRAHEFSVQLRAMDNARDGADVGLPALMALCSSLLEKSIKGGLISVGALNLGGSVEPLANAVGIVEAAVEKGASVILMPVSARRQLFDLSDDMATRINIQFYSDTPDALLKALLE